MAVQTVPTKGNLMNTRNPLHSPKTAMNCWTESVTFSSEK